VTANPDPRPAAGTPGRFELLAHQGDHPELAHWQKNVGPPVALDIATGNIDRLEELDVLSWNLAIGSADVPAALAHLRDLGVGTRPLVILAQEAFRTDESVPELPFTKHHGGKAGLSDRRHIVDLARELGMSLRYAPSMRNGASRSDRGNAILSTVALGAAHGHHLPHVKQRRVAVSSEMAGVPDLLLVSAHLDTRGAPYGKLLPGRFGAGRVVQAAGLARRLGTLHEKRSILIGADLNTFLGESDPAFEALRAAGFCTFERPKPYTYTFRTPVRLMLDHVLLRAGALKPVEATLVRVDDPANGRRVFGSDHHPLLVRMRFDG
jgi:endonuclease/exonuclease/phosphatase family metal-dependent hydrolase